MFKTETENQKDINDYIPEYMADDWNSFDALPLNWEKEFFSFSTNFIFYSETAENDFE